MSLYNLVGNQNITINMLTLRMRKELKQKHAEVYNFEGFSMTASRMCSLSSLFATFGDVGGVNFLFRQCSRLSKVSTVFSRLARRASFVVVFICIYFFISARVSKIILGSLLHYDWCIRVLVCNE